MEFRAWATRAGPNEGGAVTSESCIRIHAHGMHCHGCERVVEHTVCKLQGVFGAKADYPSELLEVRFDPRATAADEIRATVERAGYQVFALDAPRRRLGPAAHLAAAALGLAVLGLLVLLDSRWISSGGAPDITQHLDLRLLFLLGLLTGFHCVGMCGAFVLSYTADDAEAGRATYVSHGLYAAAKVLSYTLIGAGFGALGAFVSFTPLLRGVVGLCAGAFLIVYGLNVLGYLTPLRRFRLGLPKPLHDFLERRAGQRHRPFVIGLLNGLMIACGPLQAMYVSAAGTGSMIEGAKMLFAFGLGTLPVLTAFGFVTTAISGALTHRLLKLSGALVVALGTVMMNRGLILTGSGFDLASIVSSNWRSTAPAPMTASVVEAAATSPSRSAEQTIEMVADERGYTPSRFVLFKDVPVTWVIDGKRVTTCNRRILVPELNLGFDLKPGRQTIEFTPRKTGVIHWSCWMGMLQGEFEVVDATDRPAEDVRNAPAPEAAGVRRAPAPAHHAEAQSYVVRPGDSYARIAAKLLNDPKRAKDVAAANPGVDPRRLRPGQILHLPSEGNCGD